MKIFSIFAIFLVTINFSTSISKYELQDTKKTKFKSDEFYFNRRRIPDTYHSNTKIYVVGVLIHEDEMADDVMPSESEYVYINHHINLSVEPDVLEKTTEFPEDTMMKLPTFELEYGREPLEYLLYSIKSHFGIDCWESHSVGSVNQYGNSFLIPDDNSYKYPLSIMENLDDETYDPFERLQYKGPLIGTLNQIDDTQPRYEYFTSNPGNNTKEFWKTQDLKNNTKPTNAIYIGYTVGANFSNFADKFKANDDDFGAMRTMKFQVAVERDDRDAVAATPGTDYEFAFIKMVQNLENVENQIYSQIKDLDDEQREIMRRKKNIPGRDPSRVGNKKKLI